MNWILWKKYCLWALLAVPFAWMNSVQAAELTGVWHGNLATTAGPLSLELVVTGDAENGYHGTLESIDQAPGQLIPITQISLSGDRMKLQVANLNAQFEGSWNPQRSAWTGIWQQGAELPLEFASGPAPTKDTIAGLDGSWSGQLVRNGVKLRLILRISSTVRGTTVLLDSPDIGASGLPVADFVRDGTIISFAVPVAEVHFKGRLKADQNHLNGLWQRRGQEDAQVHFVRSADSAAPQARNRPQTPTAPFPYSITELSFANPDAPGVTLAGTLTVPEGTGPFPAAILISGSGPQDRDESVFEHKPFAVLADHLSRHGIAVLRCDDRGVALSSGDFEAASSLDFASDTRAAIDFLAGQEAIDSTKIGLIGHSEGGVVAPLAAVDNEAVAFVILLAAPGTDLPQLLLSQRRLMGVSQGISEKDLDRAEPLLAQIFSELSAAPDRPSAKRLLEKSLTEPTLIALGANRSLKQVMVDGLSTDWLRGLLRYDPATTLSQIRVPVLALNGGLDRQVSADANLPAIKQATELNPDVTLTRIKGLNHMFQSAVTGALGEYADIEESFAPVALEMITDWISVRFIRSRND